MAPSARRRPSALRTPVAAPSRRCGAALASPWARAAADRRDRGPATRGRLWRASAAGAGGAAGADLGGGPSPPRRSAPRAAVVRAGSAAGPAILGGRAAGAASPPGPRSRSALGVSAPLRQRLGLRRFAQDFRATARRRPRASGRDGLGSRGRVRLVSASAAAPRVSARRFDRAGLGRLRPRPRLGRSTASAASLGLGSRLAAGFGRFGRDAVSLGGRPRRRSRRDAPGSARPARSRGGGTSGTVIAGPGRFSDT